jgi:hypothetical protein
MTTMLPDEIATQLTDDFPCRDQQIQHLTALYTVGLAPLERARC